MVQPVRYFRFGGDCPDMPRRKRDEIVIIGGQGLHGYLNSLHFQGFSVPGHGKCSCLICVFAEFMTGKEIFLNIVVIRYTTPKADVFKKAF